MIRITKVFKRIASSLGKRIQVIQGGTSSSKTYSILQILIQLAQESKEGVLISIVSETLPHLKRGAMRDFFNILGNSYDPKCHNKSDLTYKIGKSTIEFFSADQPHKLRGARRDILFINEANNIRKEAYDQLEVRTKSKIFLDFNPTHEFWGHEVAKRDDATFFISTYKDNPYLDNQIVRTIEQRRYTDPDWWRVYGEGLIGKTEGLIFPNFSQIDKMPNISTTLGLDWGFSNDPTALIEAGINGDSLYLKQWIYETGLTNQDICLKFKAIEVDINNEVIYADPAEPKSIEEIHRIGYQIKPAYKGPDSINIGIQYIKRYFIKIVKDSTGLIKEARNYRWQKNRDGIYLNKPVDLFNHGWDATRYSLTDRLTPPGVVTSARIKY